MKVHAVYQCIIQNRRFFVTQNKHSRWRIQKNGLALGCVLALLLFNIYTNDQPMHIEVRHFIYADDTAIAARGPNYGEVGEKSPRVLEK